jgi:hypothetical protein
MDSFNVISKYNGGYIIEEILKVPKTVLEDVWVETLSKLKDNPDFNHETIDKIESLVEKGIINSEEIIDLLKD